MSAAAALFERAVDLIKILQIVLQGTEMFECVFVVAIDHKPFAALGFWIRCIEGKRELAAQMTANDVLIQAWRFPVNFFFRAVIPVVAIFVRMKRLEDIGASVHEQFPVVLDVLLRDVE